MDQIPIYLLLSLPLVGAFAMFAIGIVVIHQSSRVLNLAHGAMAMLPAYLTFEMSRAGVPVVAALPLGIGTGAGVGLLVERVFVRGLRRQGSTGQTVGTVAALGIMLAVAVKVWGSTPRTPVDVFPTGGIRLGASLLRWGDIGLFATGIVASIGFFLLFQRTSIGLALRAAADNRRAASLMGIDPDWTTSLAWAIGGALAGLAGVLLAAVTVLHPIGLSLLVLPAFVAALIGGLESTMGALVGSAIVGLAYGTVPVFGLVPGIRSFATQLGTPQLVLTIVALVVMSARGARYAAADTRADALTPPTARPPADADEDVEAQGSRRILLRRVVIVAALVALVVWPFAGASFSMVGTATRACILLIVASSVVLLTGWVGQISLAQATFVGIGAFTSALLWRQWDISFPYSLPIAALVSAAAAAALGVVALRVRGLYLAVATLVFAWMADEYLFNSAWLVSAGGTATVPQDIIGPRGAVPHFDLADRRAFYFIALAGAATAFWGLANLRDSKVGRSFFAVRGSEVAAASLGVDVARTKLLAFGAAGLLAGIAGNLDIYSKGVAVPSQFRLSSSLFFLAVAVVGGLRSLPGAVAASALFASLELVFFKVQALAGWLDIVSAGLLAVVLVAYPGGLAALGHALRVRVAHVLARRRASRRAKARTPTEPEAEPLTLGPAFRPPVVAGGNGGRAARTPAGAARSERPKMLSVEGVTVRFGGLVAVDDVSLEMREGEIVGLIGPNGAGKTTIFNAVSGLVETSAGRVELRGRDATGLPVDRRAALGLSRTFQVIQLLSDLTVFDNLLIATHLHDDAGPIANLFATAPALAGERRARAHVAEVVDTLGLSDVAHRHVAGLPFGVLRMVELARALVTDAPILMLDEPASGLDNAETDRLAALLRRVRGELGRTILLIEHDVRLVTSVSDYIYVVDRGRLLAEGTPAEIQRDHRVIAAYMGEATPGRAEEAAPARSGAD